MACCTDMFVLESTSLRTSRDAAEREMKRAELLRKDGLVNDSDYEKAQDELRIAVLELEHARQQQPGRPRADDAYLGSHDDYRSLPFDRTSPGDAQYRGAAREIRT